MNALGSRVGRHPPQNGIPVTCRDNSAVERFVKSVTAALVRRHNRQTRCNVDVTVS